MNHMIDLLKNIENYRKILCSRFAAGLIPILSFVLVRLFNSSIKEFYAVDAEVFTVEYICLLLAFYFMWWKFRQPPKIKFGNVGIVVAILTENDEEKKRLKNDFVAQLREGINKGNNRNFEVLVLGDYFCEKISTDDDSLNLQTQTKAHFFIWGNWKTRQQDGKEVYVLDIRARVTHAPVDEVRGKEFSMEMASVFPQKFRILKSTEIEGIGFTADLVKYAVKHCLGVASFLSGDFEFSFELHNSLWSELTKLNDLKKINLSCVNMMNGRLPLYLNDAGLIMANFYYKVKSENYLEEIKKYLDVVYLFYPKSTGALNLLAIYHFKKREIESAIKIIKESMRVMDSYDCSARLSFAFLKAYQGDLEEAHKSYKRAFEGHTRDPRVVAQVEEFIEETLLEEPDKYQLFYCLGMVNFYVKEDWALSMENFEKFLSKEAIGNIFPVSKKFAEEYLARAKEKYKV